MNKTDCYSKFSIKSTVVKNIECPEKPDSSWTKDFIGWTAIEVKKEIWIEEPLLKLINEKFEIEGAALLNLEENKTYFWHKDDSRGVTINLLLNADSHNSISLFGEIDTVLSQQLFIEKLDYQKDCFYLFNTQKNHTVINFLKPRYVFSVGFKDDKTKLTYEMIRNWAIKNNLLEKDE
jgi:hypothetical protein